MRCSFSTIHFLKKQVAVIHFWTVKIRHEKNVDIPFGSVSYENVCSNQIAIFASEVAISNNFIGFVLKRTNYITKSC